MKITITDRMDAVRQHSNFDAVVSLFDEGFLTLISINNMFDKRLSEKTHIVQFFDDDAWETAYSPRQDHIEIIIEEFGEFIDKGFDNFLIHCHGGISRSTAVAIGLLIKFNNMNIEQAYEYVKQVRPQLWPNDLVLLHFDKILELNGKLVDYDKKWKEDNLGVFWEGPPVKVGK